MSTTSTALVPSPLSSSYHTALQTTHRTASQASQAIATATGRVSQQAQGLGATTPKRAAPATPASTPGKFRHPKTTEILRRNAASSITERHVKGSLTNGMALLLTFIFSDLYYGCVNPLLGKAGIYDPSQIASTILVLTRLLFCINIILFLKPVLPFVSAPDEISDVPLTPSQRQLLGLPASTNSTPASTGSPMSYITPPRYRRASNSQFTGASNDRNSSPDRRSISANYSSSPLSTSRYTLGFSPTPSQSTVARRTASGSPFSASPSASPLFQKAICNQNQSQLSDIDFNTSNFSALGASMNTTNGFGGSPLGRSQSMRERQRPRRESSEPLSPSPIRGPQIVPGVNYKWLYDKGRKLPKSESSYAF